MCLSKLNSEQRLLKTIHNRVYLFMLFMRCCKEKRVLSNWRFRVLVLQCKKAKTISNLLARILTHLPTPIPAAHISCNPVKVVGHTSLIGPHNISLRGSEEDSKLYHWPWRNWNSWVLHLLWCGFPQLPGCKRLISMRTLSRRASEDVLDSWHRNCEKIILSHH